MAKGLGLGVVLCLSFAQRVQVSLWYILIGYFAGLSIYHSDTWTLWAYCKEEAAQGSLGTHREASQDGLGVEKSR